jgi:hypothetical protein
MAFVEGRSMKEGRNELYIRRSILRRWKSEVSHAGGACAVFSPYLTSTIAETVLGSAAEKANCSVYTLFDAEVFLNGASSIRTLKRLKENGVRLFAIHGLHAKVVIVRPNFASIGSQNLTAGGTQRREATVAIMDPKAVEQVWSDMKPWCDDANEITTEMIHDMIRLLPPLKKKMKAVRQEIEDINLRIEGDEQKRIEERRDEAARREAEAERQRQIVEDRERTLHNWNARVSTAQLRVRATVKEMPKNSDGRRFSLVTSSGDLTNWKLWNGRVSRLKPLQSYLCMVSSTWKLGFARVAKTRITFVGRSLRWNHVFSIGGEDCDVWFNTLDNPEAGTNLSCGVRINRLGALSSAVRFASWFDGKNVVVRHSEQDQVYFSDEIEVWKDAKQKEIGADLTNAFLQTVIHDQRIEMSTDALMFFGRVNTQYTLQAEMFKDCPMILAIPERNTKDIS